MTGRSTATAQANAADARGSDARTGAVVDETVHSAVIVESGRILGASLDPMATLRQVADLIVPRFADWCAVDLIDASGSIQPLTVAHRDPEQIALVEELRTRYPPDPDAPVGPGAVARTRQATAVEVTPAILGASARDERHLDLLRRLDLGAWMCAPIIASDRVLGTLSFGSAAAGRIFDERDLQFAQDLATRAGIALLNAQAFQEADRFRRILDAVVEAVFVIDADGGRIREVNDGAGHLLGMEPEAILGRHLWDLVEGLEDPPDRVVHPILSGAVEAQTISVALRTAGNGSMPVELLLQRVDLPPDGHKIVAIARDISERLDAQRRLQRLAEAEHARAAELNAVIRTMGDGIVVCAPDGRITLMNPAGRDLFPEVSETTYAEILAELSDPDHRAPRLGVASGPVVLPTRRDTDRWIEIQTYAVNTDPGRDRAAAGETIIVLRDVTERRVREAVRETFIGVLSHELRTPITTIYGGAKILAREDSTLDADTRRAVFTDIADEAERLQRLVEDVVALNRFGEDDSVDLGQEPVLLQRTVPAVVVSEEPRWPGVTFSVSMPAGLPTVIADPTYVEQTIRNLLSNAAKYSGVGANVEIVVEAGEQEVAVRVLDDGPGIERDEADRVFELFYRASRTATTTAGAGIGLFVCARLVRAMGGRIWALPRPAGGAEVGFALRVMHEG